MTRWLWLLGVLAGLAIVVIASAFLIVAVDGARHGEASLRHAAPIPVVAIVLGLVIAGFSTWRLVRRR
jgi:uncharacterized membrane protein